MKKSLLLLAAVAAFGAKAQNPAFLNEEWDGATPCFTSWSPAGSFQGFAGHDFTAPTYDATEGALTFDATTHASQHGPMYYTLSAGDDLACKPAEGLVDLTVAGSDMAYIRIKASAPVQILAYFQEGNAASWDYSKFSETHAVMDLTTSYQIIKVENFSTANIGGTGTVDLSSIGGIAFELGKTDGTNYDAVSGVTVSVDYIRLGNAVSTNDVVVNALNVYPNPATDQLNVAFDASAVSTVELTDLTGKVVASQIAKVGANTVSFETANVNAGVYFVNIKNATGNVTEKVIIK